MANMIPTNTFLLNLIPQWAQWPPGRGDFKKTTSESFLLSYPSCSEFKQTTTAFPTSVPDWLFVMTCSMIGFNQSKLNIHYERLSHKATRDICFRAGSRDVPYPNGCCLVTSKTPGEMTRVTSECTGEPSSWARWVGNGARDGRSHIAFHVASIFLGTWRWQWQPTETQPELDKATKSFNLFSK
jgi:hypothetical protein